MTFYIQRSQWIEQPVWKRTDCSLLPPLPNPSHQRTCSAQSPFWPAQASLRSLYREDPTLWSHLLPLLPLPLPFSVQLFCSHLNSSQELLCHTDPTGGALKPMISQIFVLFTNVSRQISRASVVSIISNEKVSRASCSSVTKFGRKV